ncbi:MAG: hypothetical protein V1663_03185 [archaeon]
MDLEKIYEKNYKKFLVISLLILVLSLGFLGIKLLTTGQLIDRDISIKGGISITIYKENIDPVIIENSLKGQFPEINVRTLTDIATRRNVGVIVESSTQDEPALKAAIKEIVDFKEQDYSSESSGSSFSKGFYNGLIKALIFAFIFMAIVIFITFRTFIPSVAVLLAVITDIIATFAVISLLGVRLSSAGIVAFLLVIGYSVDTDILQTTRLLRNKQGSLYERLKGSMKTGLTMTVAAIAALSVGYFFATSPVLKQIFFIVSIALIIDIIATYIGNASILIWYCKKKNIT